MLTFLILIGTVALAALFLLARPKLNSEAPRPRIPADHSLQDLKSWLDQAELEAPDVVPGAEATIQWAEPDAPNKTRFCFMYIHGFSASPQETAPVTERLAASFASNCIHTRLAGHGVEPGMDATAEDWLQSVVDTWHVAERMGERVVIVATSTGAALSVWLADQAFTRDKIHALLWMSPNFRLRNPFAAILTWPWARHWLHLILGSHHEWEPINELQEKYWTYRYSVHALIEMQKTVDWVRHQDLGKFQVPLATMYMKNDNTIHPNTAIRVHEAWGAKVKQLIPVSLDGDEAQHVFAGDITAPHRVDWCVTRFEAFLRQIDNDAKITDN